MLQPFVYADPEKCIGCRGCEAACSAVHSTYEGKTFGCKEEDIMPRLFLIRAGGRNVPVQCHHCEAAPCKAVCASGAIYTEKNSVQIDERKCSGCKNCVLACPFGVIDILKDHAVAGKCDLCASREAGPACVEVCPEKALQWIEPMAFIRQKRFAAAEKSKNLCVDFPAARAKTYNETEKGL